MMYPSGHPSCLCDNTNMSYIHVKKLYKHFHNVIWVPISECQNSPNSNQRKLLYTFFKFRYAKKYDADLSQFFYIDRFHVFVILNIHIVLQIPPINHKGDAVRFWQSILFNLIRKPWSSNNKNVVTQAFTCALQPRHVLGKITLHW